MDMKMLGVGASLIIAATGIVALTLAANEYVRAEERTLERRVDSLEIDTEVIKTIVRQNQAALAENKATLTRIEGLLKEGRVTATIPTAPPAIYIVPSPTWPPGIPRELPKGDAPPIGKGAQP